MSRTALVIAFLALLAGGAARALPAGTVVLPAGDLAWKDVKRPDGTPLGLRTVDLWGEASRGAHGSLTTFPAGLTEPPHRHSSALRVVVISGTMVFSIGGAETTGLGSGSFVDIPAGVTHFARCTPASPCEVFLEQAGAMDVLPAEKR